MRRQLAISFPVIEAPAHVGTGRVILLQFSAITDARAGYSPTYGKVIGMLENGAMAQFTIPLSLWESARRSPLYFVEADNLRAAPGALLVDSTHGKMD